MCITYCRCDGTFLFVPKLFTCWLPQANGWLPLHRLPEPAMAVEVGQQRKNPGNESALNKADEYAVTLFKKYIKAFIITISYVDLQYLIFYLKYETAAQDLNKKILKNQCKTGTTSFYSPFDFCHIIRLCKLTSVPRAVHLFLSAN